jgi:hypothetical protein
MFAGVFWQSGFLLVHFGRKTNSSKKKTNMPLTDAKVRSLKAREAQYKVSDSEGLYLLVSPSGGKLWRLELGMQVSEQPFEILSKHHLDVREPSAVTLSAKCDCFPNDRHDRIKTLVREEAPGQRISCFHGGRLLAGYHR